MNRKMAAEEIKRLVSMQMLTDRYGYKVKHGKMMCPFHGDRNASLQIYPDTGGWHCFGCGRGGSVIDFVMEQEDCSFAKAVDALDQAFGLGVVDSINPIEMGREIAARQSLDRAADNLNGMIDDTERMLEALMAINTLQSRLLYTKPKQELTADEWTRRLALDDEMAELEDKRQQCGQFREEVRQWRITGYQALRTLMKTRRKRNQ